MSRKPRTIAPDDLLATALEIEETAKITALIVVENGARWASFTISTCCGPARPDPSGVLDVSVVPSMPDHPHARTGRPIRSGHPPRLSSTRMRPAPLLMGVSSEKTRPTRASPRRLRDCA